MSKGRASIARKKPTNEITNQKKPKPKPTKQINSFDIHNAAKATQTTTINHKRIKKLLLWQEGDLARNHMECHCIHTIIGITAHRVKLSK